MITFIFRRRIPSFFSIEKIFDKLYIHFDKLNFRFDRLELPHVSTGVISVLRNAWFVARRRNTKFLHITGDVHYATLLCPLAMTIITYHDCVALQRGTGIKRFVLWLLWFALPVRLASAIVVISEQTKTELLNTVSIPERKITVIPNFVDPDFVFSERSFSEERPRILHIGTYPNKNLPNVIASLRGIPCTLVIVGHLSLEILSSLRESAVHFENVVNVDDAAMVRLYEGADIISFPSTYEGFGMPIIEGQAVGRCVLTSDQEPMRSVAGPGGALLVNPRSVDAIRAGFLLLIEDPGLRNRLIAAGRINCGQYSLAAVAERYLALYRTLE